MPARKLIAPAVAIGTRVEMVRARPYQPGSLLTLQPGDSAVIVGVTPTAYAIEAGGTTTVVLHAHVIPEGSVF